MMATSEPEIEVGDEVEASYDLSTGPLSGQTHRVDATVEYAKGGTYVVAWGSGEKTRVLIHDGAAYRVPSLEFVGVGASVEVLE